MIRLRYAGGGYFLGPKDPDREKFLAVHGEEMLQVFAAWLVFDQPSLFPDPLTKGGV